MRFASGYESGEDLDALSLAPATIIRRACVRARLLNDNNKIVLSLSLFLAVICRNLLYASAENTRMT